jgi:hypothetical protein
LPNLGGELTADAAAEGMTTVERVQRISRQPVVRGLLPALL